MRHAIILRYIVRVNYCSGDNVIRVTMRNTDEFLWYIGRNFNRVGQKSGDTGQVFTKHNPQISYDIS